MKKTGLLPKEQKSLLLCRETCHHMTVFFLLVLYRLVLESFSSVNSLCHVLYLGNLYLGNDSF